MTKWKQYDWTTREGRAALDVATLGELTDDERARGEVAHALRVDPQDERAMDAVTASLGRLVRDGKAERYGTKGRSRYARTVPWPKMANGKGAGR